MREIIELHRPRGAAPPPIFLDWRREAADIMTSAQGFNLTYLNYYTC